MFLFYTVSQYFDRVSTNLKKRGAFVQTLRASSPTWPYQSGNALPLIICAF